jgi:hypothetical protein
MPQRAGRPRFAANRWRASGESKSWRTTLIDEAADLRILREVQGSHPALAQPADDFVPSDNRGMFRHDLPGLYGFPDRRKYSRVV